MRGEKGLKTGLIAGYGSFPLEIATVLKKNGYEIHTAAVREETSPEIEALSDSVVWLHVGQVGSMIKAFKAAGVEQVIMAGKVRKLHLFRNFRPDWTAVKALMRLADRRDDTLLNTIADLLAENGITLLSQVEHAGEMLAGKGLLFGPKPRSAQLRDMDFGFSHAKGIAGLDIGQTVVVQDGAVLAVEAIEGTDEAIRRGGGLGNGKAIVVKVAKPEQDLRFDVPAIGPDTLRTMHESGCKAIAVEAGLTLLLEREQLAETADRFGISVFGLESC